MKQLEKINLVSILELRFCGGVVRKLISVREDVFNVCSLMKSRGGLCNGGPAAI